jgi:hypothetical protein
MSIAAMLPFAIFWHTVDGGKTWQNEGKVQDVADILGNKFS